jgi:hypothetical protein
MINIENDYMGTYCQEVDSVKKIHIYNQYLKRDSSKNDEKYIKKIKNKIKNIKKDSKVLKKTININIDNIEIIKNKYKFIKQEIKCKDILI